MSPGSPNATGAWFGANHWPVVGRKTETSLAQSPLKSPWTPPSGAVQAEMSVSSQPPAIAPTSPPTSSTT